MAGSDSSSFKREYCLVCLMAEVGGMVGEHVDPAQWWMATAEEYVLVG